MTQALKEFANSAKSSDIAMVSVDIFDTLLLRTTLPERVKFGKFAVEKAKVVNKILEGKKISPKYIHLLRMYAARICYRNRVMIYGARESNLSEIYDVMLNILSTDYHLSPDKVVFLKKEFREIELRLEKKDLSVNNELKEILVDASKMGKKIVAISDMYLSHEDIKELLVSKDVWTLFDNLYVSSEFGYGKACGALYDEILSLNKITPSETIHIGDNLHSDYRMPKDKGIHAFYYPRRKLWHKIRQLRSNLSTLKDGRLE